MCAICMVAEAILSVAWAAVVPAPCQGPVVGRAVSGAHPRLFLTPALLGALKKKASSHDADWNELKSRADKLLGTPVIPYCRNCGGGIAYRYQGGGWQEAIQTLGLAYQVTGKQAYANKVIEIIKVASQPFQSGNLQPITADNGFASRSAAYGLALAFDWVYDRLDDATRQATVNTLNAWFDWVRTSAYQHDGPAYGNYFGGHLLGFGSAGYATAGDNPRAQEMIAYALGLFEKEVVPAFTSGGFSGGYPVESYVYGPHHFTRLLQLMLLVKSATGQELPGAADYANKIAVNLLYNLKPNRWQTTDEGDFPGDYTGVMGAGLPLILTSVLEGTKEGRWMQFFYTHLATPADIPGRPPAFDRMLYFDGSRPALDYRLTAPTRFRSSGDEHIYVRSGWGDDAVWASFAAGGVLFADHESRKAGHIAIQRGNDYLLVNSGQWKGKSGVTGNPQAFDLASWRANTLFFDDHGEYLPSGPRSRGGQSANSARKVLLAFESGSDFLYGKCDFTGVYLRRPDLPTDRPPSLELFQRSFLYLEPNLFLVFDRVRVRKDTYVKKLYFHFNPDGKPQVDGDLTVSSVGKSTLFLRTLLPQAPLIRVEPDPVSDKNPTPITYRVEVSDSVAGTDLKALDLIAVTQRGGLFPSADAVTAAGGNMVGARVQDPLAPRLVLFSADGSAQSEVSYTANYPGARAGKHLLVDMAPGLYSVFRDGALISSQVSASSQGVLVFESPGGSFRLIRVSN